MFEKELNIVFNKIKKQINKADLKEFEHSLSYYKNTLMETTENIYDGFYNFKDMEDIIIYAMYNCFLMCLKLNKSNKNLKTIMDFIDGDKNEIS